jgi:hypothetical protein
LHNKNIYTFAFFINNFVEFQYANLNIRFRNYQNSVEYYKSIDNADWFWDSYRTVLMLPLYTPGGATSKKDSQNTKHVALGWTKYADDDTVDFFENQVFPWLDKKGRIILLKTPPDESLSPHIDCSKDAFGTRQHKLRVVLQGTVDSLMFLTKEGAISPPADHRNLFVIDGSWPHYMTNNFNDWKYTICLGAPWTGGYTEAYENIIKNATDFVTLDSSMLPSNYEDYFEDPEERKKKFETYD